MNFNIDQHEAILNTLLDAQAIMTGIDSRKIKEPTLKSKTTSIKVELKDSIVIQRSLLKAAAKEAKV